MRRTAVGEYGEGPGPLALCWLCFILATALVGCSGTQTQLGTASSTSTGATTGASSGSSSTGATGSTGTGGGTTGSASSTGGAGSTGPSTGGTTTGGGTGCPGDGGVQTEFALICSDFAPCACPLQCVLDPQLGAGLSTCEFPCLVTADCQNPGERCQNGFCTIDECGQGDGGNGAIWGACDAEGAGDGTCALPAGPQRDLIVPLFDFFPAVFVCEQNGTSTGSCDLLATRTEDSLRCAAGLVCNPNVVGLDAGSSGVCVRGCDPGSSSCPPGEICSGTASREGYCYVAGAGGCAQALPDNSYQQCDHSSQCSCPVTCVDDPGLVGGPFCEPGCTTPADCANAGTTCLAGTCVVNFCAQSPQGPAPGHYDQACTSVSGLDGTCVPTSALLANEVGVCVRGGTASTTCSIALDPSGIVPAGHTLGAAELCPVGQVCAALGDGGPSCAVICDPDAGGCPSGTVCLEQDIFLPDFGVCGSCRPSNAFCLQDVECCGGHCGSDAGRFVCP